MPAERGVAASRQPLVARLARAVAEGRYRVDARRVARAILATGQL